MAGRRTSEPGKSLLTESLIVGIRVWSGGHHVTARQTVDQFLGVVDRPPTGPIDIGFITPQSVEEGLYFAGKLRARLAPAGTIWIVYPKAARQELNAVSGFTEDMVLGMFERGYVEAGNADIGEGFMCIGFRTSGGVDAGNAKI